VRLDLGDADAAVAIAVSVLNDYLQELARIGRLPQRLTLQRSIGGEDVDITVLIDPPVLTLAQPANEDPHLRLHLTGFIEVRPAGQPDATPTVFSLDAAVRIDIMLVPDDPVAVVGLGYGGVDGTPEPPVTEADLDDLFASQDIQAIFDNTRLDLAGPLVEGLNQSRFPDEATRPDASDWTVALALTRAGADTEDSFAVTVAQPGSAAALGLVESFVPSLAGLAVAYNRPFLDLMLERGATEKIGQTIDDAEVLDLAVAMTNEAMAVDGEVVRRFAGRDINVTLTGPMVPSLVRGTTGMAFDVTGVNVDVAEEDELFFNVLKWFVTIVAGALLFTGVASLTVVGILLWLTAVQAVWNADAEIESAPNTVRESLATILGAELSQLAGTLDDDTDVGELRVDATPDSLVVVAGNMVFLAQILVVPIEGRMRSAEYSRSLRRFVIFELDDGRRFRAQELARLMRAEKVTVPGFHQVDGDFLRANPDDVEANNLLQQFKENLTTETVVKNVR
jgi:hypothetical protein